MKRARFLLTLYVLTLLGLGCRCLVPNSWDIGWYGREVGGWAMYGSEVSERKITATTNGRKLKPQGFWHAKFVSSATSRLPKKLVDDYAAWLHRQNKLSPDDPVEVKVTYRINRGPKLTVRGTYP